MTRIRRLEMKKIAYFTLALFIFLNANAYSLDSKLLDIRNDIFDESTELKPLISTSKNIVLVNSLWDSCIVAVMQLDAYFFMIGIFDSVSKDKWNEESVNYLELWLTKIKTTSELNIKAIDSFPPKLEQATQVHAEKLKNYFIDLNKAVDESLATMAKLKKAVH
jgi:hypothetical protein